MREITVRVCYFLCDDYKALDPDLSSYLANGLPPIREGIYGELENRFSADVIIGFALEFVNSLDFDDFVDCLFRNLTSNRTTLKECVTIYCELKVDSADYGFSVPIFRTSRRERGKRLVVNLDSAIFEMSLFDVFHHLGSISFNWNVLQFSLRVNDGFSL